MSMRNKLEGRVSKLEREIESLRGEVSSLRQELEGVKKGEYMIYRWMRTKFIKNSTLLVFMHYLKNHRFQKEKKWGKSKDLKDFCSEDKEHHVRKRRNYVLEKNGDTYYLLTIGFVNKLLGFDRMMQSRFLRTLSEMGFVKVEHKMGRRFVFTDVAKMAGCLERHEKAVLQRM